MVGHRPWLSWPSHDLLYSEYDCSFLSPPAEAKSLIGQMLSLRQRDRPTLEQILNDPWMKAGAQSGKPAAAPSPRQPRTNPSVAPYPTREALASNFTPPVSRCFGYCDSPKPPSSPCPPSVTPKGSPGLCRGMVEATSCGSSNTPKLKRMSLDLPRTPLLNSRKGRRQIITLDLCCF